ncbi:hypothetical protein C0992_002392 [Termitomyces sp. T32_za158]|nr:hypothetical protein C0992_002392 [Termitomyces sp. T32_za158]
MEVSFPWCWSPAVSTFPYLLFGPFMSMISMSTPPEICISFAPPEEPVVEPYSPFSSTCTNVNLIDDNAFRSVYLTPSPTFIKFGKDVKPLSPLRPSGNDTIHAQGLERERFEALIQATKERKKFVMDSTKACDLRKEITLKAHKNKQGWKTVSYPYVKLMHFPVQRRALFFSKVLASQTPNATLAPTTLPESPAIVHDTLPTPERVSPLVLFESLGEDDKCCPVSSGHEPWAEPVDFQTYQHTNVKGTKEPYVLPAEAHVRIPPSLDQISAHMTCRTTRSSVNEIADLALCPRPRLQLGVGRLQMPIRDATQSTEVSSPDLQKPHGTVRSSVKATMASATQSSSFALSSRERRAHNMLSTLHRRTSVYECRLDGTEPETVSNGKRYSAPGDLLPLRGRSGFKHPVLTLPGGF